MSADERALLLAVAADPDADLPRLVYADWLEEAGRPAWAEFIRLQCEWHRAITDPAREPFRNHIFNRLQDHIWAHGQPCPPDFGGAVAWAEYRRGLPTEATVLANELAGLLADVFLAAPLRRVVVRDATGDQLDGLLGLPREATASLREFLLMRPVCTSRTHDDLLGRFGGVLAVQA